MSERRVIAGRELELKHLDKVLFPEDGVTKGDLIDYAVRIADAALPHLHGRAVSLERYPDGIDAKGFFQKETPGWFPDWIDRSELPKKHGEVCYTRVEEPATLAFLANAAAITLHASLARVDRPQHPDRLVIDLDPSDDDFGKVQAAAKAVRAVLDEIEAASFVQTTGSRGLHVVVPLDRSADFDAVRAFARALAERAAAADTALMTLEQRKDKRGDRVFMDWLRNAYGQTSAAPYTVRAKPGAPVATPLDWDEAMSSEMHPRRYGIRNIFRRLSQKTDPWTGIDGSALPAGELAKRLESLGR